MRRRHGPGQISFRTKYGRSTEWPVPPLNSWARPTTTGRRYSRGPHCTGNLHVILHLIPGRLMMRSRPVLLFEVPLTTRHPGNLAWGFFQPLCMRAGQSI